MDIDDDDIRITHRGGKIFKNGFIVKKSSETENKLSEIKEEESNLYHSYSSSKNIRKSSNSSNSKENICISLKAAFMKGNNS